MRAVTMTDTAEPAPTLRSGNRLLGMLRDPPRWLSLADLPTPVEPAPWWDTAGRSVWIKRDDRSSTLYGGGKVRKLELALANPPYAGVPVITSSGGIGSNHLVALALFGRQLGQRLHAIVFDQEVTDHVRDNLATVASLDASFWYVHRRWELPLTWGAYYATRWPELGAYMTPGASTPLASLGFVMAGLELADQIADGQLPRPETIFITGGTGGSSAGLVLGLALAGVSTHVRIVSAVERPLFNAGWLWLRLYEIHRELRRRGLRGPGPRRLVSQAGVRWSIDGTRVGAAYGSPTPQGRAIAARAAAHGLGLDLTYTAKCAAALEQHEGSGPVLLWNTHAGTDLTRHIAPDWPLRLPVRLRRQLDLA